MQDKLKSLIVIAIIELVVVAILASIQPNSINILGYQAFNLGNRKILIQTPPGTRLITNTDSLKKLIDVESNLAFAFIGDTNSTHKLSVYADYLQMGEYDNITKLLQLIELDTSVVLIKKSISEEQATFIYQSKTETAQPVFVLIKYTACYPYFLRVRAGWLDTISIPPFVESALSAIEVRQ